MKKMVQENLNEFFSKRNILTDIEDLCRQERDICEKIITDYEERSIPEDHNEEVTQEYHEANGKLSMIAQIMDIMSID